MSINTVLRSLLVVLVLAFASLIAWSMRDTSAREGGPAPDFVLLTDKGQHVTPTSFGGKVLVLNFWASWCQPCLQEIPSLNELQREFAPSGLVVVAVSVDKNEQKYRTFLKRIPVAFDTVRDPNADVSTAYGTFQYPETYIIRDGRVLRKYGEGENWLSDDIQQYVRSVL